jgi:hypothetical protein
MELRINDKPVETIQQCGIADTMIKLVSLPLDMRDKSGEQIGWIPDEHSFDVRDTNIGRNRRKRLYNKHGKGTIQWYLSPLFGFTEYQKVLYKIPVSLILQREINDRYIFHSDEKDKVGHLRIKNIRWLIPYVELESKVKSFFLKQMETKSFDVVFKRRKTHIVDITGVTGEQTIKLFSSANPPRYLLMAIQMEASAYEINNSLFKNYGITSMQLQVGDGALYPSAPIRMNFIEKTDVSEIYDNYKKVCECFGTFPQLSVYEFMKMYPIFCFDLTCQDNDIVRNGADVYLHLNKTNNNPAKMYIVYLEDNLWQIYNEEGRMNNITYQSIKI